MSVFKTGSLEAKKGRFANSQHEMDRKSDSAISQGGFRIPDQQV